MARAKPRLDWEDLRYVLEIARGGSLAAAALALGVNASSVHRRLAAFEERLAGRLFERGRGGYRPTRTGQALVDAAGRIEAEALAAERRLLGAERGLSGVVRVSTSELLGLYLMPPLLRGFAVRYPQMEIEVSIDNRLVDLARSDADVVLRATDRPPADWIGRRLSRIASCAYAHRDYLDRVGRRRPLDEYDWIGLDQSLAHAPQARWLREQVPQARCRLRFNLIEATHQAVRAGLGVAVVPCFVCDDDPMLERIGSPATAGEFGVWMLTHPDLRRSPRIRSFMQDIGALVSAQETRLLGARG